MIKEREHVIARINQIFQVILTELSLLLSAFLYQHYVHEEVLRSKELMFISVLIAPIWFILTEYSRVYMMSRIQSFSTLFVKYLKISVLGALFMFLISYFLEFERFSGFFWSLFFLLDLVILFGFKGLTYSAMRIFRRRGYNTRQILVIADQGSGKFIKRIIDTKDWGYRIWGIINPPKEIVKISRNKIQLFDPSTKVNSLIDSGVIDEIFYCKEEANQDEVNELVRLCSEVGIVFRLKTFANVCHTMNPKFTLFIDEPFYVFRNIPESYLALKIKWLFDFFFSLVVVLLLSPIYFLIAVAIKVDDRGPVFFSQERVGLNGRRFNCLKFRTMVVNAEALQEQLMNRNEQNGPVFKIKMDPRVTRVGHFLRKTSLDELPQFINVLNGDMSVVGPRPPVPAEVEQYERWQSRRLSMKPGITCIWQVSGRNNIPFEQWMKMDMEYIDNWSLKLDLVIILKTIWVMIKGDGQ